MPVVKVTRNYQVALPAEVRRELGVKIGDLLKITVVGDKAVIEKVAEDLPAFELGGPIEEEEVEEALRRGLLRQLGAVDGSSRGH